MRRSYVVIPAILSAVFVCFYCIWAADRKEELEWARIHNRAFSFSLPPTFKKTDVRGVDSFVEEYAADDVKLSFDFGLYSNNFTGWPKETKYEVLRIDGNPARIGTFKRDFHDGYSYTTQVHITRAGPESLSMAAACRSENEVALARRIFLTIVFNEKKPN